MKKRKIRRAQRQVDADGRLAAFIAENEPRLVTIAYRFTRNMEDARDLVQEALLRACERYHQFDGRNLGGWIYTIIRNSWIEHGRSRKRQLSAQPLLTSRESMHDVTSDRAELCLVLQDVLRALRALPAKQRQALILKSTGSTYREVAKRTRSPMGTIQATVSRGRALLAEAL